uniref:Anoctamin n=1 Tax=Latimeria chalumnae TaxID=7897 RepID=H3BAT9_LATCH
VFDYLLVSKRLNSLSDWKRATVRAFIEELKKTGLDVKEFVNQNKIFYGVRLSGDIIEKYIKLLKKETCLSIATREKKKITVYLCFRIRIAHFILEKTEMGSPKKLQDLLKKGVFECAFPIHEVNGYKQLQEGWADWSYCYRLTQPLLQIKNYFGEKVALYFAWLQWYTFMLIFAALVGLFTFLYGLMHVQTSQVSNEICEANTTLMCRLCDKKCEEWWLSDTCTYAKVSHLFDNEATVGFAMFMAVWATVFLEIWKRQRARTVQLWHMYYWDEEEEELTLELITSPDSEPKLYKHSYFHSTLIIILISAMIALLIGIAVAIVVVRVVLMVIYSDSDWPFLSDHPDKMAVMTGAVIHYLFITIMKKVNKKVALFLSYLEKPRSETERERNFTVMMFTFQFINMFSSLFYIAFFLGRVNGHPDNYVRIAGKWRLEECHPSGCITDLFLQMAVIMVLKQTINNFFEYLGPYVIILLPPCKTKERSCCCSYYSLENTRSKTGCIPSSVGCLTSRLWMRCGDRDVVSLGFFLVFGDFKKVLIQYSFTTIFVAAFPLAPLLALINNAIEIRLDAFKMVRLQRRMVPKKANDIGIWLQILDGIGVLAVIANALVIAITSDFIPRLIYKFHYGPCAEGNDPGIDCLTGYINSSLSVHYMKNFDNSTGFSEQTVTYCRYRDYRDNDYKYTVQFWHIFATRLGFVILFEHVALCIKFIAAWFVPDVPRSVKNGYLNDKHKRLRKDLKQCSILYSSRNSLF